MQINTDYRVIARNCLPRLATRLAEAQAEELRAAMDSSTVFGLIIAAGPGSDIFVPSGEWINGRPAWRGLQSRLWMYYCSQEDDFTWVDRCT